MHAVTDLTVREGKQAVSKKKSEIRGLPKVLLRMDNQTMTHDLHAGSISPLHPEMSSSGYFMERNRTLGKQNSSVSSNCSV